MHQHVASGMSQAKRRKRRKKRLKREVKEEMLLSYMGRMDSDTACDLFHDDEDARLAIHLFHEYLRNPPRAIHRASQNMAET